MLSNIDIEDWKVLITKIDQMTEFLEPTDDVLELSGWFQAARDVFVRLLDTFQGKPDKNWWSTIISKVAFGSGSHLEGK